MQSLSIYTSQTLTPGQLYTRQELRNLFNIADATINTGVFRPHGTHSVWLFITEKKGADQTPYRDSLEADVLNWQGQMSGRTDKLILTHQADGIELLVFYRHSKMEHPGAGFRYLGRFNYQSHSVGHPTSFTLVADKGN